MKKSMIGTFLGIVLFAAGTSPAHADFAAGLHSYRLGDFTSALKAFKEDGSASAQFYLSIMYQKGDGTRQDPEASLAFLRKAAEQGLDVAQASLGLLYMEGAGVRANEQEGLKWLRKAADQGLAEARAAMEMAGQAVQVASK